MVKVTKKVLEKVSSGSTRASVSHGVGRRKAATARVWCYRGEGGIKVNGQGVDGYFPTHALRSVVFLPMTVVPQVAKCYDIVINVHGGGLAGQADAVKLGIARAFVEMHSDIRSVLRQHKLLTVDDRIKERKKPGQRAARAKFQFVKR